MSQAIADSAHRPLVITGDPDLLDDVLRLAAVADVDVQVAHAVANARNAWPDAPLVIVGIDLATELVRSGLPRRSGVLLFSRATAEEGEAGVWRRGVAIGADHVVFANEADNFVIDLLADAAEGVEAAPVISVVGGRGGAGATTLAAAMAITAVRLGKRALLVDGDPLGGGIDLVVGGEEASGSRWPDFVSARGRVSCATLAGVLPRVNELVVLSWNRGETGAVPPDAMRSVLSAARRGVDLVVVDLPRHIDAAAQEALAKSTHTLLLVPAEVRATVSAARIAASLREYTADLRIVVRGPAPSGLTGDIIADSLELPLAGNLAAEPRLVDALERGQAPAGSARSPLARFCAAFLAHLPHAGETPSRAAS